MDLFDQLKQTEQTVSDFMEKMDSISKEFCSHLESLKAAKKKDRSKIESKLKRYVDSLGTKRDQKETPNIKNHTQICKNHFVGEPAEEHSDMKIENTESQIHKREMAEAGTALSPTLRPVEEEESDPKSQRNEVQIHKNQLYLEPPEEHSGPKLHENCTQISKNHPQPEEYADPKINKNRLQVSKNHWQLELPDEHSDSKIHKNHSLISTTHSRRQPEGHSHLKISKSHLQISKTHSQPEPPEEHSDPKTYKTHSGIRKNHPPQLEATEEHSDDDKFLCGSVYQKPKKPLCLSIKKSVKNRSNCTTGKRLLDSIPDEEQTSCSTPKNQGSDEEQTRISISWTIKIRELSSQHTNHVIITGSEQVNGLETPCRCKPPGDFQPSDAPEHEEERGNPMSCRDSTTEELDVDKISQTAVTPNNMGNRYGTSGYEDIRNTTCKNFQECRVVVRKLSTSHKIFQPKVVLRKLTDDEINKICGSFRETSEDGKQLNSLVAKTTPEDPRSDPMVRYTSLILEPARKFPRMFSTVKMRCSIMKMVLTPPQAELKPEAKKYVDEPTTSNEIVKSMFKTKSKCVQEWRARTRTKDQGKCELNPRKSLDLFKHHEKHPGTVQTDEGVTAKFGQEIKRSKCTKGWRSKSRTKDIQGKTHPNPKTTGTTVSDESATAKTTGEPELRSMIRDVIGEPESNYMTVTSTNSGSGRERLQTVTPVHGNQGTGDNEPGKEESIINRDINGPSSGNHKLEDSGEAITENSNGAATKCPSPCGDATGPFKGSKAEIEEAHQKSPTQSTKPPNTKVINVPENLAGIPRKDHSAHARFKNVTKKSPKKMVLITPTQLKYSVKSRSKTAQSSPIQNGRVTRSRIKIEHSRTNAASHSKNMFPGSQLTFLIESFRR